MSSGNSFRQPVNVSSVTAVSLVLCTAAVGIDVALSQAVRKVSIVRVLHSDQKVN